MLPTPPRFNTSGSFAAPFCLDAISNRVICIFLAVALLLVWRANAQEKANQVFDLVRQLQSQNADVRGSAADALGQIGSDAKEAMPALIAALKDQDANVRRYAAHALGQIGPDTKDTVPALIAALKDQDKWVRTTAVCALGKIRPDAKDAVLALITALKDRDVPVRQSAANALGRIATALFDTKDTGSLVQLKAA